MSSPITTNKQIASQSPIGHLFTELQTVNSTNSYAMHLVQAKMAVHGEAFFAHHQTAGKGRQGKVWQAEANSNIILSVIIDASILQMHQQFYLSAMVALAVNDFIKKYAGAKTKIKWPNDIYYNDSKAAGILIENKVKGNKWQWAVVGIGVNINQLQFSDDLQNAISLAQITSQQYNVVELAKELCQCFQERYLQLKQLEFKKIMADYNHSLYKKNKLVKLKKANVVFACTINKVEDNGNLLVTGGLQDRFEFGEVSFVIEKI